MSPKRRMRTCTFLLALAIDRWIGEPPNRLHPVVGMGKLISLLTRHATTSRRSQVLCGGVLAGIVSVTPALLSAVVLRRVDRWPLKLLLEAWLLKTCFAYRALEVAVTSVTLPLAAGDIPAAREALGALVSRDRSTLDTPSIAAAAIESMAENLSDSFVAPLLAYVLAGVPGAMFYRAVNTADAMIGYRGQYEYLGKASARLDDLLNIIPARLTAVLLISSAGGQAGNAWQVLRQDHGLTASPNAGWPMAATAGALGVSLEKAGYYNLKV